MTPQQFIAKWQRVNLSERSACQQHFLDLCELLDQPKPADADPDGQWYTFERGVTKTEGGDGWADVWMRDHFGWEYKRRHKVLAAAYKQLLDYREDLENPPLLVVCDMDRFEVHTNFTNTRKRIYAFDLEGLAQPTNLEILRKLFTEPDELRPDVHAEAITKDAAERLGDLAKRLRMRKGVSAQRAAHFLMKLMFCMFGERIGLLPSKLFGRLLQTAKANPAMLTRRLESLFQTMADGGDFGAEVIPHFNGGLFADNDVVPLTAPEINTLASVNAYDWSNVEPSIFGTLFERHFDPTKESLVGAHYTRREDIATLVEPVVMAPLRREWAEVRRRCDEELWPKVQETARTAGKKETAKGSRPRKAFDRALQDFAERLHHVTVFDPACGSGNFLYVAINLLLDLEKDVITYAAAHGLPLIPHVRPTQLSGLEVNPFAQQLAQVVIWIGYLQWMHHNGFKEPRDPVLEPIENIRCQDAILDLSDPEHPKEPEWPEADFIVGNPPFLGGKLLRTNLGNEYVDAMFRVWDDGVPREADLCCYWFEKARRQIERKKCSRAGLLATQGIRGGANRTVLKQIKQTGDIFFAESDRDWVLDGANVHVSMVGFDNGNDSNRILDGKVVGQVNANLRSTADTTTARPLQSNLNVSFMADTKGGAFDIAEDAALEMLRSPNPHGRPNSDVVVPWINGLDVTRRPRDYWIIDFGLDMSVEQAALFGAPFDHILKKVRPEREKNNRQSYRDHWWVHVEPRTELRKQLKPLPRFIVTVGVAKHKLFAWVEPPTLPDHALLAFTRSDDCFFGVLHSRIHEVWALRMGTHLETRPRYTPTSCFETFPLPECVWPAGGCGAGVPPASGQPDVSSATKKSRKKNTVEAASRRFSPTDTATTRPTTRRDAASTHAGGTPAPQAAAIAAAAKELDELRNRWLNPPEWTKTEILEFPGSVDGPWARYIDPATISPLPLTGEGPGVRAAQRHGGPHSDHLPKGEGTTAVNPLPSPLSSLPSVGTVRWPRIVPKDADCAESLKKRTLTNLYNQRPTWLANTHQELDEAVFAAYGWSPTLSDEELLARLLQLNLARAADHR